MDLYPLVVDNVGDLNKPIDWAHAIEEVYETARLNGYYSDLHNLSNGLICKENLLLNNAEVSEVLDSIRKNNIVFDTFTFDDLQKIYSMCKQGGNLEVYNHLGLVSYEKFYSSFEIELSDVIIRSLVTLKLQYSSVSTANLNNLIYADCDIDDAFDTSGVFSFSTLPLEEQIDFIFTIEDTFCYAYNLHGYYLKSLISKLLRHLLFKYNFHSCLPSYIRIKNMYNRMRGVTGKKF